MPLNPNKLQALAATLREIVEEEESPKIEMAYSIEVRKQVEKHYPLLDDLLHKVEDHLEAFEEMQEQTDLLLDLVEAVSSHLAHEQRVEEKADEIADELATEDAVEDAVEAAVMDDGEEGADAE